MTTAPNTSSENTGIARPAKIASGIAKFGAFLALPLVALTTYAPSDTVRLAPSLTLLNMKAACAPLFAPGNRAADLNFSTVDGVRCSMTTEAIVVRADGEEPSSVSIALKHKYGAIPGNTAPISQFYLTHIHASFGQPNNTSITLLLDAANDPGRYRINPEFSVPRPLPSNEVPATVASTAAHVREFAADILRRVDACNRTARPSSIANAPISNACRND